MDRRRTRGVGSDGLRGRGVSAPRSGTAPVVGASHAKVRHDPTVFCFTLFFLFFFFFFFFFFFRQMCFITFSYKQPAFCCSPAFGKVAFCVGESGGVVSASMLSLAVFFGVGLSWGAAENYWPHHRPYVHACAQHVGIQLRLALPNMIHRCCGFPLTPGVPSCRATGCLAPWGFSPKTRPPCPPSLPYMSRSPLVRMGGASF